MPKNRQFSLNSNRWCGWRSLTILSLVTSLATLVIVPSAAHPDSDESHLDASDRINPSGTWLDQDVNWNTPGAALPTAPDLGDGNLEFCEHTIRPAALPEDEQVEAAGWTLTRAAQIYGDTTVITGMADADGMCRPLQYQVFVFTAGEFSGTLSPTPMDSRTDGSLIDATLYRDGFLDAEFNRYEPDDALCCASAKSRLFYEIDRSGDAPVLVPSLPANTFVLE